VAPLWRGGQRRGEEEDDNTQAATDSRSATESHVQGFCVAANQHVRRCKEVPFREMACPAARPTWFGPSCRPVVSLRFSSLLVASRAFCLGPALDAGSEDPQLCTTGPIQAESPRRHASQQECGAPCATLKSLLVIVGPNRSWQGTHGSPLFIKSLAARFPLRCFQDQSLRCSVFWSLKAVSPYFALLFSSPRACGPVRIGQNWAVCNINGGRALGRVSSTVCREVLCLESASGAPFHKATLES